MIRMRELIVQVCNLDTTTEQKNLDPPTYSGRSTSLFCLSNRKKNTQIGMHSAQSTRIG